MKNLLSAVSLCLVSTSLLAGGTHDHGHAGTNARYTVGLPGEGEPDRRIEVSMRDSMRFVFEPALETIANGETIEFVLRNDGRIPHEFSIGNAVDQVAHAKMMREMPGMKHSDPNSVSLEPGESARLSWRFLGTDTVVFACNIPGHFEAGMQHQVALGEGDSNKLSQN